MKNVKDKTNAMRICDKLNLDYDVLTYDAEIDGEYVPLSASNSVEKIGVENERCFKTIVTKAKSGLFYVFMLPVANELNLKKCASAVGEKSVEPISVKELLPLTGYIRGGCSPIGMKKQFVTTIHEDCLYFDRIVFSAGKRGVMFEIDTQTFLDNFPVSVADIILS